MTRVLLVSPAFHGYWQPLERALRARGNDVTTHVYDANPTWAAKVRTKLSYELRDRVRPGAGTTRRRVDARAAASRVLEQVRPDVVLAIKADVLDADLWTAARATGTTTILWLYDEVRRTQHTDDSLRAVDRLVTYSRLDAGRLRGRGLEVTYLPNAFDGHSVITPVVRDEIVFIGARYADRQHQLEFLRDRGLPVRAYGRDWSHHWADRIRTWDLSRPALPAHRDVDRATAYDVMAGSLAALNTHTDQDGFTMRTFEACGAGALQLIDRPDVVEFYDPGTEIAVYADLDELAELAGRATRDRAWAQGIGARARARTLAEHTFDHRVRVLESLWA